MRIMTTPIISRRSLLTSGAAFAASLAAPSARSHRLGRKSRCACWSASPPAATSTISRASPARGSSEVFNQQFVVENRVGAMGTLAAADVVRSNADGHTFFWAGTGTISIFPALGKAPYDAMKDLAPVSVIGTSPQVLIVNGKLPIKTLQEFVAWVKAEPEEVRVRRRRRPRQRQQSSDGAVPQARRARDECGELSRHRARAHRHHRRPCARDVHSAAGGAAAGGDRRGAHARALRRPPRVAGEGRSDHRQVRLPGIPRRELERHDGAGQDAEAIIDRVANEFIKAAKDPAFIAQLDKYGAAPLG